MFLLALVIFLVQLLKLVVDELLLSLEFVFTVEQTLAVTLKIEHNAPVVVYEFQLVFCRFYQILAFVHHACVSPSSAQLFVLLLLQQKQLFFSFLFLLFYIRLYFCHTLLVQPDVLVLSLLVTLVFSCQLFLLFCLNLIQIGVGSCAA